MRQSIFFACLLAATLLALLACRLPPVSLAFEARQILALIAFSFIIAGTLCFGSPRLAFALGGVAVLLASRLLTMETFIRSASLDVILFLLGTFLVVGYLEESHFFEHVVEQIVHRVGRRPRVLLLVLMCTAALGSALAGEVAASLFMTGTALSLAARHRINPVPLVMILVFAINIGSAAGPFGPIGVKIALTAGLSALDFVRWAAPIAFVTLFAVYGLCIWLFRTWLRTFVAAIQNDTPESESIYTGNLVTCWCVFIIMIGLFILHAPIEHLLALERDTMLVVASLLMGCVVLLLRGVRARELVDHRVDWWTLLFFMMLFAAVGALEQTGVTRVVAQRLVIATGNSPGVLAQTVGWATGILSALLDNLLAVSTFLPIVHDVRAAAPGPYPESVYWLMLFGGTFMGNATIIGSTSNIIACGLLEKRGHGSVPFFRWLRLGVPVSIASMLIATILLGAQTHGFHTPAMERPSSTIIDPQHRVDLAAAT